MKTIRTGLMLSGLTMLLAAPIVFAQRGVGDDVGVVRQQAKVERSTVAGTLVEVKDGPCENTTGRSYIGMHYILKAEDGEMINLHLGPSETMKSMNLPTEIGKTVSATAFRTDKMKEDALTAIEVTVDGKTYTLRNANLRPVWAKERRSDKRRGGWNRGR
ncbi:MAG: hypothetical protein M5U15_09485 [Kiritimatiellae bacterium]|nr:hypothetical protein [Kiritimatiellia bacterium]